MATIRSREISACLVLQTRSQLKAIYKDNADTIVGNMDSQIFLGGSEPTTLKDLAEADVYKRQDEDIIYQIVDLLVDTCATNRKLLHIAGDDKPAEVVRLSLIHI